MGSRLTRKVRKLFLDRHAVSVVVSTLIMVGAVIALGFSVLSWTHSRSSVFNMEYANLVEANSERIKEKLVFEYIFYNASKNELTVYLMNCGKSNDVSLANVYLSDDDDFFQSFSDVQLWFLDHNPTESLDIREEGYFKLSVSLVASTTYSIRIVTERGRLFDTTFIA